VKDEIVALLRQLIRFQSTHDRQEEIDRCADFIAGWCRDNGLPARKTIHDGVPSIALLPDSGPVPVLLMSHMDVVAGDDAMFAPRIENGRLYGRGAIDDKYAVALSLILCREQWRNREPSAPVGLLVTGDEEVGGFRGASHMLKSIRADFCIALDGGRVEKIVTKEKGVVKLRLISHGRAAHGARPWLGENAIETLIDDYLRLKSYFRAATDDHWHRTLNFSIVRAGQSHNQVPDLAEGVFDIRYTETDDIHDLLEKIRRQIRSEFVVEMVEPIFSSAPSAYLDLLLSLNPDASTGFAHGASDARFLSNLGIPGIVWGADGESSQHGKDEHVVIASMMDLYSRLDDFLTAAPQAVTG
jgi:succinyl-diaminopimelate desuccinylase